jgi:outer membrane protein W
MLALILLGTNLASADQMIYGESEKTFKLIPSYGLMTLKTDYENFDSKINTGVALETMLSSRFSLGLLFNYANFKFGNSYYATPVVKSEVYSLGLDSKLFVLDRGFLRPFIGAGFAYNWNNLSNEYAYNNYGYNYDYNNQTLSTNSFSGILMAGTELRFSRNFGLNLDFRYIKALVKDSAANSYYYNNYFLENISRAMEDADLMAFNIGLLIAI